jgi:hypothetical protein
MPDYAILNLREIDDSVQGRVAGLEGRFGRNQLEVRDIRHWDAVRVAPEVVRATRGGYDATTRLRPADFAS